MRHPFTLVALLFAAAPSAHAHDYWISPSTFRAEPGALIEIHLRVGEEFVGEPVARNDSKIERFEIVGPGGASPVAGTDGSVPAGLARLEKPGIHVVGYRNRRTHIVIEPALFETYLREEGLERIVEERAKRGQKDAPGREVYSRCVKSLIAVGADRTGFDRVMGFPVEIVPEKDPFALGKKGDALPLRLLHEGKPLAGAQIVALCADGSEAGKVTARTDGEGRATLAIERPGVWLVKTVHMMPAQEGTDADWESLWASITFEAGERGAGG